MSVIDPFGTRSFSMYSTNINSARVKLYAVSPSDWHQYQQYYRRLNYDDGKRPTIPGPVVSDKVVQIASKPDELVETRIDVSPALTDGFGSVIVDVEPTAKPATPRGSSWRVLTWLQSTQIGLDAFVDNTELVGFATELRSGKPLSGVQLSLYPNAADNSRLSSNVPEEKGWLDWAWEVVTGSGGPNADQIESFDGAGAEIESEAVEPVQTDVTAANGILRLGLPATQTAPGILIARRGKDTAFLPENSDY
jgi:hypothetical protein